MNATERRIIESVIDLALSKGYSITVIDDFDGCGDKVIVNSTSKADVLKVMGTTGGDRLYFSNGGGWVSFIYGNDEDVLSNGSAKAEWVWEIIK